MLSGGSARLGFSPNTRLTPLRGPRPEQCRPRRKRQDGQRHYASRDLTSMTGRGCLRFDVSAHRARAAPFGSWFAPGRGAAPDSHKELSCPNWCNSTAAYAFGRVVPNNTSLVGQPVQLQITSLWAPRRARNLDRRRFECA